MKTEDINRFDYLMGVPYKEHGRGLDGMDCYGLLMHVYKELGQPVPDYDYSDDASRHGHLIAERYHELWEKIDYPGVRPGDAILMFMFNPIADHIGVYLGEAAGEKWVLHMTRVGPVKERLRNLKRRLAGIYRLKEDN